MQEPSCRVEKFQWQRKNLLYGKITLGEGKAVLDNGETATWTLKASKLNVDNGNSDTVLVHIEATIIGSTGRWNRVLGMTSAVHIGFVF